MLDRDRVPEQLLEQRDHLEQVGAGPEGQVHRLGARHLAAHGIQTVINYPVALPFVPAYARLKHTAADFPHAHRNQSRILSLPIYPEMTAAQLQRVVDAVGSFS